MTSTGGAGLQQGSVTVVRTVMQGNEVVQSDRPLKNLAFGFGLVILPLQLFNIWPVEETMRVFGILERFQVEDSTLPTRLLKNRTHPDAAVNLAGAPSVRH